MFKKFGLAIALSATFGLIACGDDSSNGSSGGTYTISCKVTKKDPLTLSRSEGGVSFTTTIELKNGKVVETWEFESEAMQKEVCEDLKSGDNKVTCKGKKVVVDGESMSKSDFTTYTKTAISSCEESDGKKVPVDGDDEDNKGSGDSGKSGDSGTKVSSCDFDINDDVWEYTYTSPEDALGMSSSGKVRYEIKGETLTIINTSTSTGEMVKSICPEMKKEDVDDKGEFGSQKIQTTCDGNKMTVKTTTVEKDYFKGEENTKEGLLKSVKAGCLTR